MKTGYNKQSEDTYQKILKRVCKGFRMNSANLEDFKNKAIPKLPKKDRKHLENYFGINGGVNHEEKAYRLRKAGKKLDKAELEMEKKTEAIIEAMHSLDYLVLFHETVQTLVEKVARKTTGEENALEATKWAQLYATIVLNGPNTFYDGGWKVQSEATIKQEEKSIFDVARLLEFEYDSLFVDFPDGELVIPIVKEWVEDLDISHRSTVLNLFGISRPQYLDEYEGEKITNYAELRRLKERIFYRGRWVTDGFFFIRTNRVDKRTIRQIHKVFESLRRGVKINLAEPEKFPFGTGERDIVMYSIEMGKDTIEFPYIEEIQLIYPLWTQYVIA